MTASFGFSRNLSVLMACTMTTLQKQHYDNDVTN